jgi:hypothetical protein
MYLERADDEDQKKVESWKGDADGILVFVSSHLLLCFTSTQESQTGLFSAVVATLLQVSIPNLQPSSQDASAFYLANVYQLLSNENGSQVIIPSSVTSLDPSSFTVPASAVWVNSLWLLSLVISVTCALLATLLQQWARRYLRLTHPRCSPHKRARIRAFFAEGVERLHLPWTVEALPTLLHISVFLFFAGLGVYLFGVHKTIFSVVIAWVGLCVIVYAYVTALPILHKDSPYHAPLSTLAWFCYAGVRYTFFSAPDIQRSNTSMPGTLTRDPEDDRSRSLSLYSLSKTAEEYASRAPAEIDYRSLEWTFDSLDQDSDLEKFFEGVPDFCNSKVVENPVGGFIKQHNGKLSTALTVLMDRTLSSSLVSEAAKQRRITICTRAISAANLFGPWWILPRVLLGDWQAFLRSVDFGLFLKDWSRVDRPITTYYAQCVVAVIISSVQAQARDDRWAQLVTRQITASKSVLRRYFNHDGDSILLANLNNIVQQTLRTSQEIGEHYEVYIKSASCRTLESMCKLNARDTLPELQNDFCKLWDELVDAAWNGQHLYVRTISLTTLKNIRKVYISLHEGTHSPPTAFAAIDDSDTALDDITSYPRCAIDGHGFALSSRLPNVQGQPPAVGGNASQPPGSHPTAIHLPSPASMTSTMLMPLPTPVSPPALNASQAFPGHQGAGPIDQRAVHMGNSAPQAPPNGSSTSLVFPTPLAFPNPGPIATQPNP